jgi:antitoxin component YwqK of YwqJK toxin-antitoxin module
VELPGGIRTAEGQFEQGQETGHWMFRHANGAPWKEGAFVAGLPHGLWRVFNSGGGLLGEYRLEHGTGTELRFFESGKPQQTTELRQGRRHGVVTWWSESGARLMEAHFRDGFPNGSWTFWDEKGNFRKVENWKEGDLVDTVWAQPGQASSSPPEAL